jgi:hypothetical protein
MRVSRQKTDKEKQSGEQSIVESTIEQKPRKKILLSKVVSKDDSKNCEYVSEDLQYLHRVDAKKKPQRQLRLIPGRPL